MVCIAFLSQWAVCPKTGVIVTGKVYAEDEPEGFIGATVIEQDKNGRIYSSALTDFSRDFSLKIKN